MQPVRTLSFRLGRLLSDGLVDMESSSSRDEVCDETLAVGLTTQPRHCNDGRYDKMAMVQSQHVVGR